MGKSLTIDGGQNPLDAARENCTIVHGSKISNFLEIYNFLDKQKTTIKQQLEALEGNQTTAAQELEKKYGQGTVNLESGEFIKT